MHDEGLDYGTKGAGLKKPAKNMFAMVIHIYTENYGFGIQESPYSIKCQVFYTGYFKPSSCMKTVDFFGFFLIIKGKGRNKSENVPLTGINSQVATATTWKLVVCL
jgi:hypothetical protein